MVCLVELDENCMHKIFKYKFACIYLYKIVIQYYDNIEKPIRNAISLTQ